MLTGSGKRRSERDANGDVAAGSARRKRSFLWRNEKGQVRLGLANLLSLLAGVVVAWLWVALSSQHCASNSFQVALPPREEVEDALWAEGERAAIEINAKLQGGASLEVSIAGRS
jgi:hypothetical protein